MPFLRIAGAVGGTVLMVLGLWAGTWVRLEGEDPNLLVSTVPLAAAVLGLALVVRAVRARGP